MKVIGIGGCGISLVNEAVRSGIPGNLCIAVDTDSESLKFCSAEDKIQIGQSATTGLGTGCNPERGREAAFESVQLIDGIISDADEVIILSSIGGGTGSTLLPIIVNLCQRNNIRFKAIAIMPFDREGSLRKSAADEAVDALKCYSKHVTFLNNDDIYKITRQSLSGDVYRYINEHIVNQGLKQIETKFSITE